MHDSSAEPSDPLPSTTEVADGRARRLDPRLISMRRVAGGIATAILAGGSLLMLLIAAAAEELTPPLAAAGALLWCVGAAGLAWYAYRWPAVDYRHQSYRVDELGIEIRRGVFWRLVINVPRSRIQHTDVGQGPLERKYGLGTLVVYTAGSDHARVSLAGLPYDTAVRIRERLLPAGDSGAV
jgi:membrane protein YdbS with pleckstrin-like domain